MTGWVDTWQGDSRLGLTSGWSSRRDRSRSYCWLVSILIEILAHLCSRSSFPLCETIKPTYIRIELLGFRGEYVFKRLREHRTHSERKWELIIVFSKLADWLARVQCRKDRIWIYCGSCYDVDRKVWQCGETYISLGRNRTRRKLESTAKQESRRSSWEPDIQWIVPDALRLEKRWHRYLSERQYWQ